jgi:hypothetical protein
MNWIRGLIVVLVILTIGTTFVLSADTMAVARSDGTFCKNYCQAHYKEHHGMGSCINWCKYYYFMPAP